MMPGSKLSTNNLLAGKSAKDFTEALQEAQAIFGNIFTRKKLEARKPVNVTEQNWHLKLFLFLKGEGGYDLTGYKFLTIAKLFICSDMPEADISSYLKAEVKTDKKAREWIENILVQIKQHQRDCLVNSPSIAKTACDQTLRDLLDAISRLDENENSYLETCKEMLQQAFTLIEWGGNPDVRSTTGIPLLHYYVPLLASHLMQARIEAMDSVTRLIEDHKADIQIKNPNNNRTLFNELLFRPRVSPLICIKLITLGAYANSTGIRDVTIVHLLTVNRYPGPWKDFIEKVVSIDPGTINQRLSTGETPLAMLARTDYRLDDALFLIELGADPNVNTCDGQWLLEGIVTNPNDHSETIQILMEKYKARLAPDDKMDQAMQRVRESNGHPNNKLAVGISTYDLEEANSARLSILSTLWGSRNKNVTHHDNYVELKTMSLTRK